MTPVILYHSRTGFTQQYAAWLSEDLRCPALPYRERGGIHWSKYDTVLFGSWFHAGSVMGKKWLKQQLPQWKGEARHSLCHRRRPGGGGPDGGHGTEFHPPEWAQMRAFYLPGGLRYEAHGCGGPGHDGGIPEAAPGQGGAGQPGLPRHLQSFDLADRAAIAPIVDYCRTL